MTIKKAEFIYPNFQEFGRIFLIKVMEFLLESYFYYILYPKQIFQKS